MRNVITVNIRTGFSQREIDDRTVAVLEDVRRHYPAVPATGDVTDRLTVFVWNSRGWRVAQDGPAVTTGDVLTIPVRPTSPTWDEGMD